MVSAVWTLFRWSTSSMYKSSSLWQRSLEDLTVNSCSRAVSISSCSGRSLSNRAVGMTLGRNMYILAVSGIFSTVGWSRGWVPWGRWSFHGAATHGEVCVRLAIGMGMAESVSIGLTGSSVPSVEGGAPRTTDSGFLLGILHWETGVEAAEEAHCSHSKAPWRCRLMTMVMSWGVSIVSARGWISTSVVEGVWMVVVRPSGCTQLRSMSKSCSSWKGLLEETVSQRDSSGKVNCRASNSSFRPLGQTTLFWWSQPQVSAWGMPSIMVLIHSMGVCGIWHCLAILRHMASLCCCLPVSWVCRLPPLELGSGLGGDVPTLQWGQRPVHTWQWGSALSKEMPHPARVFRSPHTPARDRVFSCACMITCTWKLSTTRQKSSDPLLPLLMVPTNWHLWKGQQNHS